MRGSARHSAEVWRLVRRQHGVITRRQLLELGYTAKAIEHRIGDGRLHVLHRGTYAVGRPEMDQFGQWMAAVLASGEGAVLSHRSAAELWGISPKREGQIEVSAVATGQRRVAGVIVHRRRRFEPGEISEHHGIPVTSPVCTLIDLAACISRNRLEAAVNEADRLGLTDPERLRVALDDTAPRPGVGVLRALLDRQTFTFTRSELERRFKRIAREAGLPKPRTCVVVNGFEVDFYWPELPLVVETDGLTYHRTPAQQKKDRLRDQAHTVAGVPHLRFTHTQVRDEPTSVRVALAKVVTRLLSVTLLVAALTAGCGGDDEPVETEPPPTATGPPPDPRKVFAKLPPPRYLDQDPPACCPGLTGGWQFPYLAYRGDEVTATLSSPGQLNADVVFRVEQVTARGKPLRVVRERRVHVDAIQAIHEPYLSVQLPDVAPAYYALELELHPDEGPVERYVSYTYLRPPGRPAVELTLEPTTAEPGDTLELTVHNSGTARLEYGLAYRLERRTGLGWRWINRDAAFALILLVAEPGRREREKIRLPDDLRPGRYRIVKEFTARPSERRIEASVEFTAGSP